MKKRERLGREFWIWIVVGLIAIGFFGLYVNSSCSKVAGDQVSLCGTRVSDLGLIYLTYCLVVVGYFQIRRGEKNLKEIERAVVVSGPLVWEQVPIAPQMIMFQNQIAIRIVNNTTELKIGVTNNGRTAAIMKETFVQFALAEPTGPEAVYGTGETRKYDMGIPANNATVLVDHKTWVSNDTAPHYCYGFIRYSDIFRDMHTNRFCVRIEPGTANVTNAGSEAYNDWD